MRTQLLCTFSNVRDYESDLLKIASNYDIIFNKIYILQNVDEPFRLFLTYNIDSSSNVTFLDNTLAIHRKKHTNTIYTINALNELVMESNGGVADPTFRIDWHEYENTIILTDVEGLKYIETSLYKIIKI